MGNMVSNQIISLRKGKKLTQQGLAEAMNVSTAAVCKWETGSSVPDISTLCALADYFKVSVDYILGREEKQKKCVLFCPQKEYASLVSEMILKHDVMLMAKTNAMSELEAFLEKTIDFVPQVIAFSTSDIIDIHSKKLDMLRKQYGFDLMTIVTATVDEFDVVFEMYQARQKG